MEICCFESIGEGERGEATRALFFGSFPQSRFLLARPLFLPALVFSCSCGLELLDLIAAVGNGLITWGGGRGSVHGSFAKLIIMEGEGGGREGRRSSMCSLPYSLPYISFSFDEVASITPGCFLVRAAFSFFSDNRRFGSEQITWWGGFCIPSLPSFDILIGEGERGGEARVRGHDELACYG